MKPTWERGNVRLYLGDCRDVLPHVEKVDACVTDPPYGIGACSMTLGNGVSKIYRGENDWDSSPADVSVILKMNIPSVIWGGNYFELPPSRRWLVWDKGTGSNDFADCELAWTNIDGVVKMFHRGWVGSNAKEYGESRHHPTQKPVSVMEWCMGFINKCASICDLYMGSGTTGVAAVQTGRSFVGIEIDPTYFEIAVRRIDKAIDAGALFAPVPPAVREVGLWEDAKFGGAT